MYFRRSCYNYSFGKTFSFVTNFSEQDVSSFKQYTCWLDHMYHAVRMDADEEQKGSLAGVHCSLSETRQGRTF